MSPSDGTLGTAGERDGEVVSNKKFGVAEPVKGNGDSILTNGRNAPGPSPAGVAGGDDTKGSERKGWRIPSIMKWWEWLIILLTIAPMAGFTVVQPYLTTARAELGCGPVCIGSMTSISSALGIFGAPLVGALSDHQGRRFALALGTLALALSFIIQGTATHLAGLWIALIPPALFSHNFTITKAVVADLSEVQDRASTLGKLGLAAGLGFMCGPVVQLFIKDFRSATAFATMLQLVSLAAVHALPTRDVKQGAVASKAESKRGFGQVFAGVWAAIKEVGELAVAAPPAAKSILFLRFGLSMGFHVFYAVMQVLLKDRHNFGPNEYSNYFAFIGLVYGTSQIVSKFFVNKYGDDPTWLIMLCTILMGVGRYFCAITHSLVVFYASVTLTVLALGIINNSINTTVTRIGTAGNVGGLMGVLDTAEKLAGVVGPTLGGLLYAHHEFAPVLAVCLGYVVMCAGVSWAFPKYLVPALETKEGKAKAE